MDKPLRIIGIALCGAMLGVPPMMCFLGASARVMAVMHFVSVLFPVTFFLLSKLFIEEGREQERAERERADQERRE